MSPDQPARWPAWVRFLVGAFALIGFAYTAVLLLFSFGNICTVEDSAIVPSPSDAFVARVTVRTCGKNAPITEINVSPSRVDTGRILSESVFSAPAKTNENGGYEQIPVHVAWQGSGELQVSYPYAMQFNSRVHQVQGVRISYIEVSPRSP